MNEHVWGLVRLDLIWFDLVYGREYAVGSSRVARYATYQQRGWLGRCITAISCHQDNDVAISMELIAVFIRQISGGCICIGAYIPLLSLALLSMLYACMRRAPFHWRPGCNFVET